MKARGLGPSSLVLVAMLVSSCTSGTAQRLGTGSPSLATHSRVSPPGTETSTSPVQSSPRRGRIPSSLRRPLHLPMVEPGGACPRSTGRAYTNDQFGGIRLGTGSVLPLVGVAEPREAEPAKQGVLRFHRNADYPGWFRVKTLWFSFPKYQGPALIRGRQLDGSSPLGTGEEPSIADPEFQAGPTVNGEGGFREWPGATWLHTPGCYGWQVDGLDFSYVIVFTAEFAR
jgi:hypothetical protein